ncbi:MAG: hypothetical protein WDN75_21175 [Bacteroidota bacterium]
MESYLYTIIAVVLGIGLVFLSMSSFNLLAGKTLTASILGHPARHRRTFPVYCYRRLIAGSYPAFYLTSFKPVDVLKGRIRAGMKSSGIRNFLVVFQFIISITLIISTLMVYKQLKYVQNQNLGFDKENVIDLHHTIDLGKNGEAFKNELLKNSGIKGASYVSRLPPNTDWTSVFRPSGTEKDYLLNIALVDYDHLSTMDLTMAKAAFFSRDFPTDTRPSSSTKQRPDTRYAEF